MITVLIECNRCGAAGDALWSHPGGGAAPSSVEVRAMAANNGWLVGRGGSDLCPDCRPTPSADVYDGPGETVWRKGTDSILHAVRRLHPNNPSSALVTCCDSSWVVSYDGQLLDYRFLDGVTCRKGGCAAYFEASREGRLG